MRLVLAVLLLAGCTETRYLVPNAIEPEIEHMSHITQHAPIADRPTAYGANMANLVLHWDISERAKFELVEGISLDHHWANTYESGYGEILGPREQFSARFGYSFQVRSK